MKRINISVGDVFSHLTVVSEPVSRLVGKTPTRFVTAECDCGRRKDYRVDQLNRGLITSCGCVTTSTASISHWSTRRYNNIKHRCYNPKSKDYINYGARGIKLYEQWKNDSKAFYDWCDRTCPDQSLTLERIDVNGHYEPDNLKWVSRQEQMFNRRDSFVVTHGNKIMSVAQVHAEAPLPKCSYDCFRMRIKRGWRVDEALQP